MPIRRRLPTLLVCLAGVLQLLVVPVPGIAQEATGTLVGAVRDAGRDAPLAAAQVAFVGLDRSTLTDARGRFRFEDVPAGTHELIVTFLSYESTVREVRITGDSTERLLVWVTPEPTPLEELTVTGLTLSCFPGFLARRAEGKGHFFTRPEVLRSEPEHLTEVLRDVEGVRIGFNEHAFGASRRYPQFYSQGPAYYGMGVAGGQFVRRPLHCRPAVFVNSRQIGPGHRFLHFNEFPPHEVLAMEVYHRGRDVPEALRFAITGPLGGDEASFGRFA